MILSEIIVYIASDVQNKLINYCNNRSNTLLPCITLRMAVPKSTSSKKKNISIALSPDPWLFK